MTYGGAGSDFGYSVVQTRDGGYAVAGYTDSFGAGDSDFYLLKIYPNGDLEWSKTYGGAGDDFGLSMVQTIDGGYALVGSTDSFGAGSSDVYLVKFDSSGNVEWDETFGGTDTDLCYSVIQTSDGGYTMVGATFSFSAGYYDYYLVKVNSEGRMQWQGTYGLPSADEFGYSVIQTSDGGYAVAGKRHTLEGGVYACQ